MCRRMLLAVSAGRSEMVVVRDILATSLSASFFPLTSRVHSVSRILSALSACTLCTRNPRLRSSSLEWGWIHEKATPSRRKSQFTVTQT